VIYAGAFIVECPGVFACHVEFARAVGQIRLGNIDGAKQTLARIHELGEASTDPRAAYFRRQLEIQHRAVAALIANAEGRRDEAVAMLQSAATDDDTLGKHPVSPGKIYPVRELLGDLLLELDRPADALLAFEQSLSVNPGRLSALGGAANAADRTRNRQAAPPHYQQLLAQAGHSARPQVAAARQLLAADGTAAADEP
jgi:tetratricopeptide (TPR) repeat protein